MNVKDDSKQAERGGVTENIIENGARDIERWIAAVATDGSVAYAAAKKCREILRDVVIEAASHAPTAAVRDRPATNPGGCECQACGCVFVGAEWHVFCGACVEGASPKEPDAREGEFPTALDDLLNSLSHDLETLALFADKVVGGRLTIPQAQTIAQRSLEAVSNFWAAREFSDLRITPSAQEGGDYALVPRAATDAIRAVLRNEHDVYETEDALYEALLSAAAKEGV